MADRVLIPLGPDLLILTAEEYATARDRGRTYSAASQPVVIPAASGELVTAPVLAMQLSLAKSCIYEYAKAGRIPCVRVGKHVRFDPAQVRAALGIRPVGQGRVTP